MQISIYKIGNTGMLCLIHFTMSNTKSDWRPTHPLQRVSRVPDYLHSIQGLLTWRWETPGRLGNMWQVTPPVM